MATVSQPIHRTGDQIDGLKARAGLAPYREILDLKPGADGNFKACCPWHDDRNPSLVVYPDGHHHCFACEAHGDALDLIQKREDCDLTTARQRLAGYAGTPAKPTIERVYKYTDEAGQTLFQVVRYTGKKFQQRKPNGRGGWLYKLDSVRKPLYRLPEVIAASEVFFCEGEKDVETVRANGRTATTAAGGANAPWLAEYTETLSGKKVFIIPDNDEPGKKRARQIYEELEDVAEVRIVEIPAPHKDVTDYVEAGGSIADLKSVETIGADSWPEPDPLPDDLPPVEAFSKDMLPRSLLALVEDVAERMQVPIDYPAVVMLLCIAGAVNRRAVIQPKASDTSWRVVPNLWGGIVAPPGYLKSPVIQAVTAPLNQIQNDWRKQYEEDLQAYAAEKEEHILRLSAWKEQFKSASKSGKAAPERPGDEPAEPKLRRLIMNDATFEALHQTMSDNPAGVLVSRDELPGWWSQLDRAGREGERAFSLQAWNGDTGHTIDRIGRGTVHVEACCMSMLGGIQPGRLRSYLPEAIKDGPGNDGLIQRFQLLVWPDTDPGWRYVDRLPNTAAAEQTKAALEWLTSLDAENPLLFRFSPEAQRLFVEWLEELEGKVRREDLHPALTCHISKYRSLMPSLALLFELADAAAESRVTQTVSLRHAEQAAAWCAYLESHARRIYSCVVTPQLRASRDLASKIKRGQIGTDGPFSCRDIYLKGWSGLDSPEAVKQAVDVLEDSGWLRPLPSATGSSGGRPSAKYEVNPKAVTA